MSWGTQPGTGQDIGYSRSKFYVHSTNRHDHGHTVRPLPEHVKFPPEVVAQMKQLVDDPLTAYRSLQDLIRDAVYHRLHDLAEMRQDGEFLQRFQGELLRQAILERQHETSEVKATIDMLDAEVEEARDNPDAIADIIRLSEDVWVPPRLRRDWEEARQRWQKALETAQRLST